LRGFHHPGVFGGVTATHFREHTAPVVEHMRNVRQRGRPYANFVHRIIISPDIARSG
jgi:hypothetical protein